MNNLRQNKRVKRIFINQQKLEHSLINGKISLEGSIMRSKDIDGYYQLIPAIKFTACVSNPDDPLGYVGKCAALALFEQKGIEIEMHSIDYKGETFEVDEGFFGDYHSSTENRKSDSRQAQRDKDTKYDPGLIKRIYNDYKALNSILDEIKDAARNNEYGRVKERLKAFGDTLRIHLMKEQVNLHNYLEKSQAHNKNDRIKKKNRVIQKKIMNINQAILHFLEQYGKSNWTKNDRKSFSTGLKNLTRVMSESMTLEEELYELYLPESAYNGAVE